jgi:UDP-3-O-[3-hydroxymyristoyl] glucosamine N-acyltransferase
VEHLAAMVGAALEGDGTLEIRRAAALDAAERGDIAFVGSERAFAQAESSRAGCLVAGPEYPNREGRTVLRVEQPRAQFARIVAALHPQPESAPGVHPTAVVAASAELGEGVSIGPHCTVGERVRLGAGTVLRAGVTIYDGVEIGARCLFHAGCVIGADGFGFVFENGRFEKFPQVGRVVVGDDVEMGAHCCVDRAALGETRIGDGCKFDNMVHIAHNCRLGRHIVIAAQTGMAGGCVIEDYAVIGGQVGLGEGVRIEQGATLGSGAGVLSHKVIRRGQTVWGTPARPLKQHLANLAGLSQLDGLRRRIKELEQRLR